MLKDLRNQLPQKHIQRNYKYKRLSREDGKDDSDSGTHAESLELSNRYPKPKSDKPECSLKFPEYDTLFERPIQEGESLNSISLKYRISVADLKRVNRLQKEMEFYALNSLKIPVKSNSVLYEVLQEECSAQKEEESSESARLLQQINSNSDLESEVDIPVGLISISQICREKETRREAKQFLLNMQKDLQKYQEKTKTYKDTLDEAAASLTNVTFSPMEKKFVWCSESDLSLKKVLLLGGLVVIGVPFLYLVIFSL